METVGVEEVAQTRLAIFFFQLLCALVWVWVRIGSLGSDFKCPGTYSTVEKGHWDHELGSLSFQALPPKCLGIFAKF